MVARNLFFFFFCSLFEDDDVSNDDDDDDDDDDFIILIDISTDILLHFNCNLCQQFHNSTVTL